MVKLHVELIKRQNPLIEIPQHWPRMPALRLDMIENKKRVLPELLSDVSDYEKEKNKSKKVKSTKNDTMIIRKKKNIPPPVNIEFEKFPRSGGEDKPVYKSPAISNVGSVRDLHEKISPRNMSSPFNDPLMFDSPAPSQTRGVSPLQEKAHLLKSPLFRKPFPRDKLPKANYESEDSLEDYRKPDRDRHSPNDYGRSPRDKYEREPPLKVYDKSPESDDYDRRRKPEHEDDEYDRKRRREREKDDYDRKRRRDEDDYDRRHDSDDYDRRHDSDDYDRRRRRERDEEDDYDRRRGRERDEDDYDRKHRHEREDSDGHRRDRESVGKIIDKYGDEVIIGESPIPDRDSPDKQPTQNFDDDPNNPYHKKSNAPVGAGASISGGLSRGDVGVSRNKNISEEEENKMKKTYLEKYNILQMTYNEEKFPQLGNFMDLDFIINTYETEFKRVTLQANLNEYKMYLVIMFCVFEYGLKYLFDVDTYGFVKQQLKFSHKYDKLLVQLGERQYMSFGNNWPAELKIVVMFGFHIMVFFASKQIGKKFGQHATDTIQDVLGNVGGITQQGNVSMNPLTGVFNMFMGGNIKPNPVAASGSQPEERKQMKKPTVDLEDL